MNATKLQRWTKEDIMAVLPHRDPMIFVDGVEEIFEDEIITFKDVHEDETYFKGHFPDNKIFPGVFMIEGAAQSSIILLSHLGDQPEEGLTPLLYHTDFKFKKTVKPNARIYFSIKLVKKIATSAMVEAKIIANNATVAKGKLTFVLKKM